MKRPLLNRQRDWLDIATVIVSLVAIILAVALPLTIRWLDRRDMIPAVSLRAGYLQEVSPDLYPELVDRLTQALDLVQHIERKYKLFSSPIPLRKEFTSLMQLRMFEVLLSNTKPTPVFLTQWDAVDVKVERPDGLSSWVNAVTVALHENGRFEVRPVIGLEPFETKKVRFLVCYLISPRDHEGKKLAWDSVIDASESLIASGNTNIHRMAEFQRPGSGQLAFYLGDANGQPIDNPNVPSGYLYSDSELFLRVACASLHAQVKRLRPVTTRITATDHLGHVHESNLVDFRGSDL